MKPRAAVGLLCVLSVFVTSCSNPGPSPTPAPPPTTASTTERETIRVLDHDGKVVLRLKADKKGYKVFDEDDQLLARLKDFEDHIKVENDKRPLLRLKRRGKKFKSWVGENEAHEVEFTFGERDDGGYELSDGYGDLLYTVRRQGQGFEVLDAQDKLVCRMVIANSRVIAERPDGFKLFEIHGSTSMVACSALMLDKLSATSRAAIFAFLHQLENGDVIQRM